MTKTLNNPLQKEGGGTRGGVSVSRVKRYLRRSLAVDLKTRNKKKKSRGRSPGVQKGETIERRNHFFACPKHVKGWEGEKSTTAPKQSSNSEEKRRMAQG